jgi:glutathione-independent formaldehyde dehydrogenase
MKAVVYDGPNKVSVKEVPNPKITHPTDAIIKLTTSAICGSDLHMYQGHTVAQPGIVFGHEPMGVVDEVGSAVKLVKKGDRVVMPFNVSCGFCINCIRGYTNACLTTNPEGVGGGYGYVGLGPYRGGQAEYVLVPHADWACLKLPGKPFDSMEDDFVLLADVFPTAYHACEMAGVQPGYTVAIFGAGPVGLLAAMSATIKGASEIYVVDYSEKRLSVAKTIGATPINFKDGDPAQQIMDMRKSNQKHMESLRPGEEKMGGVMCGIDAVGYQAVDRTNTNVQKPMQVINDLVQVVNPTGKLGIIGVYLPQDPMGPTDQEKQGMFTLPLGKLWEKGLMFGTGQAPVKNYHKYLRDLIIVGKAKPSTIITNHIKIDEAPETYKEFAKRDKIVKPVIQFK